MSAAPTWQLDGARPGWWLESREPRVLQAQALIYRAVAPAPELIERSTGGASVLGMKFALYGVWQEINSPAEGHFLERIQHGAFRKSINENLGAIRAVLSHGKDQSLGETVLGKIESITEEADGANAR